MADNKIITDEILKKATENILQLITDNSYNFVPYTQEEIQEVFDLDEVTAQSLSKVINDEFIAKNKVYSNEYTNTLLEKVKAECNQYTVEQIANSGNLKRKIVTATTDVTDESILYLILTDSTNNIYTQYMLIDGTATPLGTTQVDLSDYLLISDFNTTIADYAKKNETVAQNDVMADLTTLSSNTVLSTQGVSDELNKKVDKTSIVTSISSTSTDDTVPSAKAVYDNCIKNNNLKTYTKLEQLGLTPPVTITEIFNKLPSNSKGLFEVLKSKVTDMPTVTGGYALLLIEKLSNGRFNIMLKPSLSGSVVVNELYIGQLKGLDGTGITWKRVCTTSVADVDVTEITTFTDSDANGKVIYSVKNGICYVTLLGLYSTTVKSNIKVCGLPSATTKPHVSLLSATKGTGQLGIGFLGADGIFTMHIFIANVGIYTSFSYPVAES